MAVSTRLVGRDPALAAAGAALDAAVRGTGRLLLISGDAGIGKSALARALAEDARDRRVQVLWAACSPGGGAPAYWPWTQLLREVEEVTELPEVTHRLIARGTPASTLTEDIPRLELYDAVDRALAALTRDQPAMAVLDDLHWADEPSLDLLDSVARRLAGRSMLVVGTYRDLEAPAALHRIASAADGLTLGGLDVAAVAGLVTAITGSAPGPENAEEIRGRTGGNPLFIRELSRLMVARGTGASSGADLPATVAETLRDRLSQLSDECRELLRVIAIADAADPGLLGMVTGLEPARVAALIEEAIMARVLTERAAAGRPLVHDLFREELIAETKLVERARIHGVVAGALIEQRSEGAPIPAGRIAGHLVQGREDTAGADWSILAAEEATVRLGHEEAVRHYQNALDLRSEPADPTLLLALAGAQLSAGDTGARESYLAAAEASRRPGEHGHLTAAALGLHRVGARGDHTAQLALLEEAVTAAPRGTSDRVRLLAALGRERRHAMFPVAECRPPAEEAVEVAREVGDPVLLAHCLLALHDAVWASGTATTRLAIVQEVAQGSAAADDAELAAQAQVLLAACLIELNDPEGLVQLAAYCRRTEALGHARGRWEALSRRATLGLVTGAVDEALDAAQRAYEEGVRIGIPDVHGVHGTQRWPLSLFLGDRLAVAEGMRDMDDVPHVDRFLAAAQRAQGNADEARLLAVTLPPDRDEKYDLEFVALAADALAAAGSTDAARDCYEQLLPFAGTNVLVGGCAYRTGDRSTSTSESWPPGWARCRPPSSTCRTRRRWPTRSARPSGLPTHWDGVRRWRPPPLRCASSRRVTCGG